MPLYSLLLTALGFTAQTANAQPANPSELVTKIQKFYDSTKDLHAKFDQQLESGIGGKKKASGDVWLKKPGKMRWDYAKPEKKLMLSDGQTLWVYEPEDEQAFKQELRSSTLPLSVTFLFGQGKLSDEFAITVVPAKGMGQEGDTVLKLIPKTATTAYRYLLFVVDSKTGLVRETIIYDQQGGTNPSPSATSRPTKASTTRSSDFLRPRGPRSSAAITDSGNH